MEIPSTCKHIEEERTFNVCLACKLRDHCDMGVFYKAKYNSAYGALVSEIFNKDEWEQAFDLLSNA